ncbi:MAG: phosphoglucosamine mutase [Actinomycetota bacterium]
MLHFGTDGVRGRALTELTESYATALGAAAMRVLSISNVVIGRDTRESGEVLEAAFAAGCARAGATVHLVGVAPTPAIAAIAAEHNWAGVVITASHNDYHDNGIKIFDIGGLKLTSDQEIAIESELSVQMHDLTGSDSAPSHDVPSRHATDMIQQYVRRNVEMVPSGAFAGMHIVLDCANGAMSDVAGEVFAECGAMVTVINCEPDGRNINANCGAMFPDVVSEAVRLHHGDIGLAFDGDGDRVIAVDGGGNIVDGDHLIALAARDLHDSSQLVHSTVVVTVMTNIGFHLAMADAGIRVVTTPVGDRSVLTELDAHGYVLGGEQSGHIIYRSRATTGDGLLAGILLADMVRRVGMPLRKLAAEVMTSFPQVLVNVNVAHRDVDVGSTFADEIEEAQARLGNSGRVLLRSSGTEPVVRVMVEARSMEVARETADRLAAVVAQRLG